MAKTGLHIFIPFLLGAAFLPGAPPRMDLTPDGQIPDVSYSQLGRAHALSTDDQVPPDLAPVCAPLTLSGLSGGARERESSA